MLYNFLCTTLRNNFEILNTIDEKQTLTQEVNHKESTDQHIENLQVKQQTFT